MLKLLIDLEKGMASPILDGGKLSLSAGIVHSYAHPALETVFIEEAPYWLFMVREKSSMQSQPLDENFRRTQQLLLNWPLDFVMLSYANGDLTLQAGALGTTPIYFTRTGSSIIASWDFADCCKTGVRLNIAYAASLLAMQLPYTRDTIFENVTVLTERASVIFTKSDTIYKDPPPAKQLRPRAYESEESPDKILKTLVTNTLDKRGISHLATALELSGGMDSAATGVCAAHVFQQPLTTLGIEVACSQIARRAPIIKMLQARDVVISSANIVPALGGGSIPAIDAYVDSDFYLPGFDSLWAKAQDRQCKVLLTGCGGDELFPIYSTETSLVETSPKSEISFLTPAGQQAAREGVISAPASPVPHSALRAMASSAIPRLGRGLWPVTPLSDPVVVHFCRQLPAAFRCQRAVLRTMLNKALGAELFPIGYQKENFESVMLLGIRQHQAALQRNFISCLLVEIGLIQHGPLKRALEDITLASIGPLCFLIYLERFLRYYL